jgi:hypothetical protein
MRANSLMSRLARLERSLDTEDQSSGVLQLIARWTAMASRRTSDRILRKSRPSSHSPAAGGHLRVGRPCQTAAMEAPATLGDARSGGRGQARFRGPCHR